MVMGSFASRIMRALWVLVAVAAALALFTVTATALGGTDGQCDAAGGKPCVAATDATEQLPSAVDSAPAMPATPTTAEANTAETRAEKLVRLVQLTPTHDSLAETRAETGAVEIGRNKTIVTPVSSAVRLGLVFAVLLFALSWVLMTIKFAFDGSLPARLAIWGLLPEAFAAISVRAVVALLRLKGCSRSTPAIVLRGCITDAGAAELAEGMRLYGEMAELEVLELPHNRAMTAAGVASIVAAAERIEELDLSYNPQLGDALVEALRPLLQAKASKLQVLRLADVGLSVDGVRQLAEACETSKVRTLDLSYTDLGGAAETAALICDASVLEELSLQGCNLTAADVGAVAEQLPYTSIRSLQLGGNGFGNEGLSKIAAHLPTSLVEELGLESNGIEAEGLSALGAAWAKRPFSRVRLSNNRMTQEELATFIRTLKSMQC